MLRKNFRLSRSEIISLRKTGKRFQTNFSTVICKENKLSHLRLSTEISLKVDKRSVVRNRIRRQIYLLVEKTQLVSKPLDVLIIVKLSVIAKTTEHQQLQKDVNQVIETLITK